MAAITLTDSEWLQLLDGRARDSALPTCCSNVSALRDVFVAIVRSGRDGELASWAIRDLQRALEVYTPGHDLTPVLQKVCDQIGFETESPREPAAG